MKNKTLTCVVFLFFLLPIIPINAQDPVNSSGIIIEGRYFGVTLNNILDDFEKKYGLQLDLTIADLPGGIQSGQIFDKVDLNVALQILLKGTGLHYKIVGRRLIIRKIGEDINYKEKEKTKPGRKDFTLYGRVKDKVSGETLPYAQVLIDGTLNGTTTNIDGYFTLFHVPIDTAGIIIRYVGFRPKLLRLDPDMAQSEVYIEMTPETTELEQVTISAVREDLLRLSNRSNLISMSPSKIALLPSLGEKDIFRSFQLLPGISGSQESSSGLYIRGGTPDQNLVLYDGFTVYHVDHLFGMFSAFNPDAIKDVKLSKGGYEAKYGGRLSSVMEITGKDGNEKGFDAGGTIGLISASGYVEIPLGGKGSILLSGRRSFQSTLYTKIFEKFQSTSTTTGTEMPSGRQMNRFVGASTPSSYFYDLNAKVTFKPNVKDIYSLSFYHGKDVLDNSNEFSFSRGGSSLSGGRTDLTDWGNWGSSLKWSRRWSEHWYSHVLGSYSNYFSNRDMSMASNFSKSGETSQGNMGILESNDLGDFSLREWNEWKTGKNNQLEFGLEGSHYKIDYSNSRNDTIQILNEHTQANLATGFVQDRLTLFERLTLVPGIRATFYNRTNKAYLEPRVSMNLGITDKIKLKAAWGIYNQFANRIIRDDLESGSRDFWLLADGDTLPVGHSEHFITGLSWENKDLLFSAEAFYKKMDGLTEYAVQFVPSYREIHFDEFFYKGTGVSKGIELLAQKKLGKYNGWISYTLQQVRYQFDIYGPNSFPASQDITQELKVINLYSYRDWNFSAVWIYGTGKPYTAPLGAYQVILPDGTTKDFISIGQKNAFRLPDYHRLDISAQYNFVLGNMGTATIGLSVFNVYNRKNVWYKQFSVIEGQLVETNVELLGITPNLFLSFKFR
jgi:ferric enterobactin receptor